MRLFTLLSCLLCVSFMPIAGRCQTEAIEVPEDEPPGEDLDQLVRARVQRGDQLVARGQLDAAIVEYQAAYEIDPQPDLLYRVARAEDKGDKLKQALRTYDRFLQEAPQTPRRKEVEERKRAIYQRILAQEERERDRRRPVWQRPWFWAVVSGSVVVVGVGLGVGLALGLPRAETTLE